MDLGQQLAELKSSWDELRRLVPWSDLEAGRIADKTIRDHATSLLRRVFHSIRDIESVMSQSAGSTTPILHGVDASLVRVYIDEIRPRHDKVHKALDLLSYGFTLMDLIESASSYDRSTDFIRRTLEVSLRRWDEDLEEEDPRRLDVFSFEGAWEMLDAEYFQPDRWLQNVKALKPIILGSQDAQIPKQVKRRLLQAYRSFIFENWAAAVAMARAILEYAILDRARQFSVDTRDLERPEWESDLKQLITAMPELYPNMEDEWEYIRRWGNSVMHPVQQDRVIEYPSARDIALRCLDNVRRAIEALYTAHKQN